MRLGQFHTHGKLVCADILGGVDARSSVSVIASSSRGIYIEGVRKFMPRHLRAATR